MPHATVALDFHETLDVHGNLFPQISFDSTLLLQDLSDTGDFIFREVPDFLVKVDTGEQAYALRPRAAYSKDVSQTDFHSLFSR